MRNKPKHAKMKKKKLKKIILIILIVIFIVCIIYIANTFYSDYKDVKDYEKLNNILIDTSKVTQTRTEKMLKIEELQKDNSDVIGWLQIEGTKINYPVVQTTNNDFYLNHNYKKDESEAGSLFLDKDFDLENGSSNYLIYGHRHKKGIMFEDLIKYAEEDFYKEHTKIQFATTNEDATYEILAVFYSRVYYKREKNVFRYYYFVNANNEDEYNDYVNNAKKASIYDTGVTAKYGDQLLTLSTCEYSQKNGRFVVVAKKVTK